MKQQTTGMMVLAVALGASQLMAASTADAQARSFNVARARVTFTSDAPLETIRGVSSRATGSLSVDPSSLSGASGTITVPVSTLRTGIDLRDEHLHSEQWLDAGSHPNATFEVTGISGASSLTPDEDTDIRITGRFTIHGVTHDVTARVRAKWDGADTLRARASFSISLSDYNISIPTIVQAKVSNTIAVQLQLRLSA